MKKKTDNVANETGKTPLQLANENKELLEALENVLDAYSVYETSFIDTPDRIKFARGLARKAIQKAKQ